MSDKTKIWALKAVVAMTHTETDTARSAARSLGLDILHYDDEYIIYRGAAQLADALLLPDEDLWLLQHENDADDGVDELLRSQTFSVIKTPGLTVMSKLTERLLPMPRNAMRFRDE